MPLFKGTSSKSTPKKVIAYITDPKKGELISVRNLFEDEDYAKQFIETQRRNGKCAKYNERKYYHFKLSCARKDNVSPQRAQIYAEELTARLFPDCECVIATHTDTKTVHSHIVVNAVNPITGRKLHITDKDYDEMKNEAGRLGAEMGFSMIERGKKAKNKRTSKERHIIFKGGTSWKEELREVIQEGITVSKSEMDFISYLKTNYGVEITRNNKDFSYRHPQKQKSIRGERLGENYTKSEVLRKIGEQNYRKKSATYSRGRRSDYYRGQSGFGRTYSGKRPQGITSGQRFIEASISDVERAMQELSKAATAAACGNDAASEDRKREQQRIGGEVDGKQRERNNEAGQNDRSSSNAESGNNKGSSDWYGKGE